MPQLVWLVTGCSSGFGESLVHQILAREDKVIATGRRLESLKHLDSLGARTMYLDVTDNQEALNVAIQEAIAVYGRIDVLVNNAGYASVGACEDLGYDRFLAQFDTNVFGVIKVTSAILPHFRQNRSGSLVFIGSIAGWSGNPISSAYCGSKFALEGFVESLSKETAHLGIKSLLVEPGRFRTKLLSAGNVRTEPSKIQDYNKLSSTVIGMLAAADQKQPGDPQKGAEVILDLVRKEGSAAGKDVPLRLPLGADCYGSIKEKCEETLKLLEEWKTVIHSTDY